LNHYDYENYKKLLPEEIKEIDKDIKFHEDRIEMIENSDQDEMVKDEDIKEEMDSIKELKEEKKQLEELKNRIRTNLLTMP
jgi:coenzyme F420-reducing hydrogenase delta subunit